MEVVELDARVDYRLRNLTQAPVWYTPADAAAEAAMDQAFARVSGHATGTPCDLPLLGRLLHVPQAANGVARFPFDDLCRLPLGAADFLELAQRFHTVFVDAIPVMAEGERNAAKRFITMIDAFYDAKVKLLASAAAAPDALYAGETGAEAFEFARCVSRLIEMRSLDYLAAPHGRTERSADLGGLVET